mgnify:CR=1 FL=1
MEKISLKKLGHRLRFYRTQKNLTQEALALMCDIDRTYIGRIEKSKRNPSFLILLKIAKGLGIKISELVDIDSELVY